MRALVPAAVAALSLIAVPGASARPEKMPKRAEAVRALEKVEALREGRGVRTGFELSPALAQLAGAIPALGAADRRQAEAFLARPDDDQQDPDDTHKWTVPEAPTSPYCGPHFCVHWVLATGDAPSLTDSDTDGAPDYVEQMERILETEVFPCENGTGATPCAGSPGLAWRQAASDGSLGGNEKVDVYIQDLFTSEKVFGYVAPDPGQPRDPAVPHHAYMVMDKDYRRFGDGSAASGLAAERVTAAHEYNHVLQNAYDYLEDSWMFESSAVYMEEKVYPQVNDYLSYVEDWTQNTRQPLTTFTELNLKPYGSAVWNHWLEHRFGPPALRSVWEQSVSAADFAPAAYGKAIANGGGGAFGEEFARFAVASAEWNVFGSGFPDRYPDVPRDGALPIENVTAPFALPHTTYALFDVPVTPDAPPVIRLTATLPDGTAGAVGLVGRKGPDANIGALTTNLTHMPNGGTAAVQLDTPAAYGRVTAVVVNSDTTQSGFDAKADDYVFTKDAPGVVALLQRPGRPNVTTGQAGLISDHGAFAAGTVDPHMLDSTWWIEYGRTSSYGSTTAPSPLPASTVGAPAVSGPLTDLKANTTYHFRIVAANGDGSSAGPDQSFQTFRDVTPPKVALKVKRQKLRSARTRGALYLARCSEDCRGRAEIRVTRRTARRLGLPVLLGKTRVELEASTRSSRLRVRLADRVRRRFAGLRRGIAVTLAVNVVDADRNRRVASKRLRLVP